MDMRKLIAIVESEDFDGYLYHATPNRNLTNILENGIQPVSYWGEYRIAKYYAEDIVDNGDQFTMFRVPLSAFVTTQLEPDFNGIEEPLAYTLGMSEDEIWGEWNNSDQSWKDSLEIIGSVQYRGIIPPNALTTV